jgi:alpha-mannosidase
LYLEFHRGTLTTQARVKALNRAAEHRLLEAEAFGALAARAGFPYPHDEMESAWKTLLLNQFHDILPGSSIREVYEDAVPMLEGVVATATVARDAALRALTCGEGGEEGWIVANASARPRPLCAILPLQAPAALTDGEGRALPSQVTEDGLLVAATDVLVPALGWVRLGRRSDGSPSASEVTGVSATADGGMVVIENDLLRVVIGPDGTLASVIDKAVGREALAGWGNQLWAYTDKPRQYDAWDIEETYEQEGQEVAGLSGLEIVEQGPLRAAVRVSRTFRGSRIQQTYRLVTGSRRLDIVTEIDWHERMVLLKARLPVAVRAEQATFETMYGVVRRPTHRNTTWDAARFEASACSSELP